MLSSKDGSIPSITISFSSWSALDMAPSYIG
jgi:hypothetical protein